MATTRIATGVLFAAFAFAVAPSPAVMADPDPQHIAEQCIQEAQAAVAQRVHRNHGAAANCIQMIEHLLGAGNDEQALHVAENCIDDVVAGSHQTITSIDFLCSHCVQLLLSFGAPKLAEEVTVACEHATAVVNHSRLATVNVIKEALLGGTSTEASCRGDLDGNGGVGGEDLALLIGAWGTESVSADLDSDGLVSSADLVALLNVLGPCP
jgi:hypothetical protein